MRWWPRARIEKGVLPDAHLRAHPLYRQTSAPTDCPNDVFDASSVDGLFGGTPFPVAAYAYDCVIALASAATRTPGGPTNATGLHEQLLDTQFDGASGEVHFDASGDRAQVMGAAV